VLTSYRPLNTSVQDQVWVLVCCHLGVGDAADWFWTCWHVSLLHGVGGKYGMAAELGHIDIVEYAACRG